MKKLCLLVLFSTNLWSSDLSRKYLLSKVLTTKNEISELQKYKILLIPGVLAQSFISNSHNQIKLNVLFDDAFKEQTNLFENLNIDYEFLKLESENSPEKNAKVIIEAIELSKTPVIIYSHSKGGLDVLEALRENPKLMNKIHGWATIQSPFWGAPVATGFNGNTVLRNTSTRLFEWMGGDAGGMTSLTIEERNVYMNSSEIKNLLTQINSKMRYINFASFKTNTFGLDTPLELFRNYTDLMSGKNDGVVPLDSALMTKHGIDIDYIIESEVDHLMTMTRFRLDNKQYNQQAHTIAILKMLL